MYITNILRIQGAFSYPMLIKVLVTHLIEARLSPNYSKKWIVLMLTKLSVLNCCSTCVIEKTTLKSTMLNLEVSLVVLSPFKNT